MHGSTGITVAEAKARGHDPVSVGRAALNEAARQEAVALVVEIEAAFAGVPRPVVTLSVARGYDDEWSMPEDRIRELNAKDPEANWQEVPDEAMQSCQDYFTFSDAEGWRFYLPAYMCHYLRHFPGCGWDAVYWACVRRDHVELLSNEQLRCLSRFTELCQKYESPA